DRDQEQQAGPSRTGPATVALAATDPANPYGAALPWPALGDAPEGATVRPARRAGALVLLMDGAVAALVDRGGKPLLCLSNGPRTPPWSLSSWSERSPRTRG